MASSLNTILSELNLDQYLDVLLDNGFDSWDVIQDITENDLHELGFKLGHRRILQRAIAETPTYDASSRASTPISPAKPVPHARHPSEGTISKRRYRRHPRADPHAPKRPKTAYVMFADHLRADPSIGALTFVEISRIVGMRWQALPREQKYLWDIRASQAMQLYTQVMEEYRKTETFREHQRYLEEFRRKHQPCSSEACYAAVPEQRPTLEAVRENSSSSGLSGSTQVEHSDENTRYADMDKSEMGANEWPESGQERQAQEQKRSRSSIHALLQAAEESDRVDSSRATVMNWQDDSAWRQKVSSNYG
ncbi:MAG: hypothetical protein M1822_006352 [Bathelium mastoideum]|nr:MAG: hypothetical protein M1822_006352 [Bathelium mastoideum]